MLCDFICFQNGETPLHIAAKNNRYKTMQLLIQSKPEDKNTILNEKNNVSIN